jgi:ubiquinone/menaquinone biosynthesis C-methylase UbiE
VSVDIGQNFDLKEEIRAYWSRRASTFDESASHRIENTFGKPEWQKFLRKAAGLVPPADFTGIKALDFACGTGEISRMLCSLGADVTGLDFSEVMLEIARVKLKDQSWTPLLCDAEHLVGVPDNNYDFAITRHLAWTLTKPEAAFAEWIRVLKPGGRLLINDGDWSRPHSRILRFKRIIAQLLSPDMHRTDEDRATDTAIRGRLPYSSGLTSDVLKEEIAAVGFQFVEELDVSPLYGRGMRAWPIATRLRQTSENRFALVFEKPRR